MLWIAVFFHLHTTQILHRMHYKIRRCIQKFPNWPPGAWELQMVRLSATRCSCMLFVSQSSEFCHHNLCVASQRVIPKVRVYFIIIQSGNLFTHPRTSIIGHNYASLRAWRQRRYVTVIWEQHVCMLVAWERETRYVTWHWHRDTVTNVKINKIKMQTYKRSHSSGCLPLHCLFFFFRMYLVEIMQVFPWWQLYSWHEEEYHCYQLHTKF
jgi:hypothetical protein